MKVQIANALSKCLLPVAHYITNNVSKHIRSKQIHIWMSLDRKLTVSKFLECCPSLTSSCILSFGSDIFYSPPTVLPFLFFADGD